MKSPYLQGLRQGFLEQTVYSVDFLLGIFQAIGIVIFEILLWTLILPSASHAEFLDRVSYFLLTNGIASVIGGARFRFARVLNEHIKNGTLTHYLLRPISPTLYIFTEHLGGRAPDIYVGIAFMIIGSLWLPTVTPLRFTLFVPAVIIAFINTYAINIITGALAFWTTEAAGMKNAIAMVTRLLNGQQIPLKVFMDVLPPFWSPLIYVLPFASVAFTPIHILTAKTTYGIDSRFLISAFCWALILPILATIIWRKGLRRYEGTGN